jgi:hypothetical protein
MRLPDAIVLYSNTNCEYRMYTTGAESGYSSFVIGFGPAVTFAASAAPLKLPFPEMRMSNVHFQVNFKYL